MDYPSTRLANISELSDNIAVDIAYPDAESPGVLIKLGRSVPGGVGPAADIVAFSVLCPHKGYQLLYSGEDKTLNCPGHYSRFDVEKEGQQIFGMSNQNLPKFDLRAATKLTAAPSRRFRLRGRGSGPAQGKTHRCCLSRRAAHGGFGGRCGRAL